MFNIRLALVAPAAALFAVCSSGASAGPFDPKLLPPDVSFVLHYDMDRFINSIIGQTVQDLNSGSTFFDDQTIWGGISKAVDFDLSRDLKSVTVFNAGEVHEDIVAAAVITEKIDQLFKILPAVVPSHRLSTMDGHEVHSWTEVVEEARRHWYAHVRAWNDDLRLVIVGRNWEQVLDTIERAASPELDRPFPPVMLQPPGPGSIVYIALANLNCFEAEAQWISQVARTVEGFSIDLREHETKLILESALRSPHEDEAAAVAQLLQGLVAMARLAVARDPDPEMDVVRDALRQTQITTDRQLVTVRLVLPLDLAIEAISGAGIAPHLQMRQRSINVGVSRHGEAMETESARDQPQ